MSEAVKLRIEQIVVSVEGSGELCAVLLPEAQRDMLVALLPALADGPLKLAKLPGVKMVPIADLDAAL